MKRTLSWDGERTAMPPSHRGVDHPRRRESARAKGRVAPRTNGSPSRRSPAIWNYRSAIGRQTRKQAISVNP